MEILFKGHREYLDPPLRRSTDRQFVDVIIDRTLLGKLELTGDQVKVLYEYIKKSEKQVTVQCVGLYIK